MKVSILPLCVALFGVSFQFSSAQPVAEVVNTLNTGLTLVDVAVGGPGVFVLGVNSSGQGQLNLYSLAIPPVLRDTVLTGPSPQAIATSGARAYVANFASLRVIDATNPADLAVRGTLAGLTDHVDLDVAGTWVFSVGSDAGHPTIRIIDVSSADNPIQRGQYRSSFSASGTCIEFDGFWAFLGMAGELTGNVDIVSIVRPESPQYLSTIVLDSAPRGIERVGASLFITGRSLDSVDPGRSEIHGISNPFSPEFLGQFAPGGFDIAVTRGLAIVAQGSAIHGVDVGDPASAHPLGSGNIPSRQIALGNGFVYVIGGARLTIYASTADPLPDGVVTLTQDDLGATVEGELFFHEHIDEQDDLINHIWYTGLTGTQLANFLVGSPSQPEPDGGLIPSDQPELQLKAELLTAHFNTLLPEPALDREWFLNADPITDTVNGAPFLVTPPQHSALAQLAAGGTTVGHVIDAGAAILFTRSEDPPLGVTVNGVGGTVAEVIQVLHLINDSFAGGTPTGAVITPALPRP